MSAPAPTTAPSCEAGHGSFHPLEIFPFFRRFRPSFGRDILYTFIWNCGLGFIFWVLGFAFGSSWSLRTDALKWYLIIANAVGYSLHGLFSLGDWLGWDRRARAAGGFAMAAYYSGVSLAGALAGFFVFGWVLDVRFLAWMRDPRWVGSLAFSAVLISLILSAIFFHRERSARAEAEAERQRLRVERVEREAALANLRALQAQIEPHFLFNTLANVASLIDADPAQSRHMLERFIRFLRASLAATRAESTTLEAEGDLIAAYLEVLRVRMGPRLRYAIAIDPAVASFPLAPMLLQPIVENAIRHGLEPNIEGGEVRLGAKREGDSVVVEVADTGAGFEATTFGGVGLANLRDRLRLLYGDAGSLVIAENPGGGTLVRLTLPA